MHVKTITIIGIFTLSLFLYSCTESSTLDTTSSAAYKQSLQKLLDAQKDEQARIELVNSISSVVTNGKDWSITESNKGYDFYDLLNQFGNSGRLMPLNGKNTNEILKMGYEERKKWVLTNIPPRIEAVQKKITELNEKKAYSEQIENTENQFQLEDVRLSFQGVLEDTTKRSSGEFTIFVIRGKGTNNGTLPIYSCDILITVTDTKDNFKIYNNANFTLKFSPPIEPGTYQEFDKKLNAHDWRTFSYEKDRYILHYTIKNVNASHKPNVLFASNPKFTKLDAKELEIFEEQLKEYTELIEKFMDSQNSNK